MRHGSCPSHVTNDVNTLSVSFGRIQFINESLKLVIRIMTIHHLIRQKIKSVI
jgi:hypothetical protein